MALHTCRRYDDGEELWLVDRDGTASWWCPRCCTVTPAGTASPG